MLPHLPLSFVIPSVLSVLIMVPILLSSHLFCRKGALEGPVLASLDPPHWQFWDAWGIAL